jgi:hypothetical protein
VRGESSRRVEGEGRFCLIRMYLRIARQTETLMERVCLGGGQVCRLAL